MKKKTFSILATLLFVVQGAWAQETETPTWSGSGTENDPYLIQKIADWNKLAEGSKTNTYAGVYFKQTFSNDKYWDDHATTMVGTEAYPFAGNYDGGGNRLDVKLEYSNEWAVAPFRFIKNATIKHLYLYGVVEGNIHVSGLVGRTVDGDENEMPTNIIEDCRVGAYIYSKGTHAGGFIGHGAKANNILKGCLFDGRLYSQYQGSETTYAAPFIGWCHYAANDRNTLQGCFEKGIYEGFDNTALYYVLQDITKPDLTTDGVTVYRTFHSQNWNDGHRGYTVTSGTDGMSLKYFFEAPDNENIVKRTYSTSGITYYDAGSPSSDAEYNTVGIVYDNMLYVAEGNLVAIYPQSASKYYNYTNFEATSGSLSTITDGVYYELTMGAGNSVITASPCVLLGNNDAQNLANLEATNGKSGFAVKLYDRTLSKTGLWNTLCLPFELTVADSPLAGATIKTLDDASLSEDGTLQLDFSATSPATIAAGTPFIVKWENTEGTGSTDDTEDDTEGTVLKNPKFSNVTISNTLNHVDKGVLTFKGTFSPYDIEGEDHSLLYLGGDNQLYYPNGAMTIGACRAYFQLADGITAGEKADGIRAFILNFGDGEQTGIEDAAANSSLITHHSSLQQWYTLDGRRLSGKPTQPGIYVENGKKVVMN